MFAALPMLFLLLGGALAGLAALIRFRNQRRWFPVKVPARPRK
jgi:hypothetical protein